MPTIDNPTAKTLADLGVHDAAAVLPVFGDLRARFDLESAAVRGESDWKTFRDAWLGRKSGILTQITDNWLRQSPPSLKGEVGRQFNQLKSHVEQTLEEQRKRVESGAEESALAR